MSLLNIQIEHREAMPPFAQIHPDLTPAQAFNEEDEENVREERVTASDVLDVFRKYGVQASRNDATAAEDQYDEPEDDDADADSDPDDDDESEEDAENELEELVTASDVSNVVRKYANQASRSDATVADDESEEAAENELEKLVTSRLKSSESPSRNNATCPPPQNHRRATTPLAPPPQDHRRATTPLAPPPQNHRRTATLPLAQPHPRNLLQQWTQIPTIAVEA